MTQTMTRLLAAAVLVVFAGCSHHAATSTWRQQAWKRIIVCGMTHDPDSPGYDDCVAPYRWVRDVSYDGDRPPTLEACVALGASRCDVGR